MRFFSKGGLHPPEMVSKSHLTGADWAHSSAVEHYLDMVGVTGSIPVAPTTRLRVFHQKPALCVIIPETGKFIIVRYRSWFTAMICAKSVQCFWLVPAPYSPYNPHAAAPIRLVLVTLSRHHAAATRRSQRSGTTGQFWDQFSHSCRCQRKIPASMSPPSRWRRVSVIPCCHLLSRTPLPV